MTAAELAAFEADIAAEFNAGRIRAPIHLSGGCEREIIEIFRDVRPTDWVCTNWRSHYHCLLKGVPRERLKADILAGKSIALNYPEYRIISSAIVGGALPIALGVALSIKRKGGRERVFAFCGDMAERSGIFHEVIQYAVGHDLPLCLVVEDNGLSVFTDTAKAWGESRTGGKHVKRFSYKSVYPHSGIGRKVVFF